MAKGGTLIIGDEKTPGDRPRLVMKSTCRTETLTTWQLGPSFYRAAALDMLKGRNVENKI